MLPHVRVFASKTPDMKTNGGSIGSPAHASQAIGPT